MTLEFELIIKLPNENIRNILEKKRKEKNWKI